MQGAKGAGPRLEQQAVAGADGERGDLRQRVGARLEDDEQHADRTGLLLQDEALRNLRPALQLRAAPGMHTGI